jgi:FkbM family methyltransferase
MKELLRKFYRALPLKLPLFLWLRSRFTLNPALWTHLYFEGPFEVPLAGKVVKLENYNCSLETEIFWAGFEHGYEPLSQQIWIELCRRSNTILDVGANTGLYSLIAKSINPAAQVWSFEPIERIYNRMVKNFVVNNFDIHHHPWAVSNKDGEATIYDLPHDHHWHASLLKEEVSHLPGLIERRVPTRRLDTLIATEIKQKIDLIKIDAEGFEPYVLEGLGDNLAAMTPALLLEIKSQEKANLIASLLKGLNYLYFDINEKSGVRQLSELHGSTNLNVLVCPPQLANQVLLGLPGFKSPV